MVSEEKKRKARSEDRGDNLMAGTVSAEAEEIGDRESEGLASAKGIPRPPTSLPAPPRKNVGEIRVSLLLDKELVPSLEEVQKINRAARGARTPLMTVIQSVLAGEGGSMTVADLTDRVRKYWNRPFPTSPYTPQEFTYIVARNSGDLRLDE